MRARVARLLQKAEPMKTATIRYLDGNLAGILIKGQPVSATAHVGQKIRAVITNNTYIIVSID